MRKIWNIVKVALDPVCLQKDSNKIKIKKGVRQGDTMSPKLFITCLGKIFRTIDWIKMVSLLYGRKITI